MAYTRVLFRSQAREKILNGVNTLADAVRVTLGPKSKCVLIQRRFGPPTVCNDGVTIAKEMRLEDPNEDLGAQMIRQAAERTGDAVGDGTSTSVVLAQAIVTDGIRNVVAGASAIDLKRGLDRGVKAAVEALTKLSRPVKSRLEKAQVATVAAHNDATIGEMVAEAMQRVGDEGVITVEESKTTETQLEVVEGLQFDRGYVSPYFVTDPEKMEAVLESPLVLLYDGKLGSMKDLLPLLEQVARAGQPLLAIAEDIEGEALATLVVNKLRGTLRCVAVKAPGYGDRRKEMMDDIGVLTAGRVLSPELGVKLENVATTDLGRCQRVVTDRDATTIVGGAGDKQAIEGQARAAHAHRQEHERLRPREARGAPGEAVGRGGGDPGGGAVRGRDEEPEGSLRRRHSCDEGGRGRGDRPRRRPRAAARDQRGGGGRGGRAGRRAHGAAHPHARAGGAHPPHRGELGGGRRRRGRAHAGGNGQLRLRRRAPAVRRPRRERHHRPHEGRPHRARERRVRRQPAAPHGGGPDGGAGEEGGVGAPPRVAAAACVTQR